MESADPQTIKGRAPVEPREDGEQFVVSLSVAMAVAALVAVPLFLVLAQAVYWVKQGFFRDLGDVFGTLGSFVPIATGLVAGAVIYTIVQEIIVLLGRSRGGTYSPATMILVLVPLCVVLDFVSTHFLEGKRLRLEFGFGFLLPSLVLVSLAALPCVAPPLLLRYAMSRSRGLSTVLTYVVGLVGLGFFFLVISPSTGSDFRPEHYARMFLYAVTGFLAGGLGQLASMQICDAEPDGLTQGASDKTVVGGLARSDAGWHVDGEKREKRPAPGSADSADRLRQFAATGDPKLAAQLLASASAVGYEPATEGWESPGKETADYHREAMASWRRLWIAYNAILLAEGTICLVFLGILIGQGGVLRNPAVVMFAAPFFFGIAANMAFILGPAMDLCAYVDLRIRMGRGRYILFAIGLSSAMLFIYEGTLFAIGL